MKKMNKWTIFLTIILLIGVIVISIYLFNLYKKNESKSQVLLWFEENRQNLEFIAGNIDENLPDNTGLYVEKIEGKEMYIVSAESVRIDKQKEKEAEQSISAALERIKKIDNREHRGRFYVFRHHLKEFA